MSLECGECERDLRGPHDESCYRFRLRSRMARRLFRAWTHYNNPGEGNMSETYRGCGPGGHGLNEPCPKAGEGQSALGRCIYCMEGSPHTLHDMQLPRLVDEAELTKAARLALEVCINEPDAVAAATKAAALLGAVLQPIDEHPTDSMKEEAIAKRVAEIAEAEAETPYEFMDERKLTETP